MTKTKQIKNVTNKIMTNYIKIITTIIKLILKG